MIHENEQLTIAQKKVSCDEKLPTWFVASGPKPTTPRIRLGGGIIYILQILVI